MTTSLERGVEIIRALSHGEELTAADLAEIVPVSRATVFRLLASLTSAGFIERSPRGATYRLVPHMAALGRDSSPSAVMSRATIALADLRETFGEAVNFATYRNGEVRYVACLEGKYWTQLGAPVGGAVALHATAIGKALLAAHPEPERARVISGTKLTSLTPNTITHPLRLAAELRRIAAKGFAIDDRETDPEGRCVGVAIIDPKGAPVAALSVSGRANRMPRSRCDVIGQRLVEWGRYVSDGVMASTLPKPPQNGWLAQAI